MSKSSGVFTEYFGLLPGCLETVKTSMCPQYPGKDLANGKLYRMNEMGKYFIK